MAAEFTDPASLVAGRGARGRGLGGRWVRPAQAATAWRQAVDHFVEILGERPDRGAPLDLRVPALPATPAKLLAALPIALSDMAGAAGKAADAPSIAAPPSRTPSSRSSWRPRRPWSSAARSSTGDRPVSWCSVRRSPTPSPMRAPLRDPAVEGSDRGAGADRLAGGHQTPPGRPPGRGGGRGRPTGATSRPTVPATAALAPARGEARVYYARRRDDRPRVALGPRRRRAARVEPAGPQGLVAALLGPALGAVLHPPVAWPAKSRPGTRDPNARDWEALTKPVATLLPFLNDKAIAGKLAGKRCASTPTGRCCGSRSRRWSWARRRAARARRRSSWGRGTP